MNSPFQFLILFLCLAVSRHSTAATNAGYINPLLKNASFVACFGFEPAAGTNEDLRIAIHLDYVEQLLRKKPVRHLDARQRINRKRALDILATYRLAGRFPKNYDHADRKPCFIDRDGNICAVGYLIEHTSGRALAEAINARYQYAHIREMKMQELDHWMNIHGLSREECAMIQPNYGPAPVVTTQGTGEKVVSVGLSAVNLFQAGLNSRHLLRGDGRRYAGVLGMFGGIMQMGWGVATYQNALDNGITKQQVNLLAANLIAGSAACITGGFNFIGNRHKRKKSGANQLSAVIFPVEERLVYGLRWQRGW